MYGNFYYNTQLRCCCCDDVFPFLFRQFWGIPLVSSRVSFCFYCLGKPFNRDNMCLPLPVTGFPRPGCFCSLGKNNRQVSSFFGRVSSRVNNKHELRKYKYVGPDSDEKSNVKLYFLFLARNLMLTEDEEERAVNPEKDVHFLLWTR